MAHFGISEGKGGLKHGSRPWLGMDIFWNCPLQGISNNKKKTIQSTSLVGNNLFLVLSNEGILFFFFACNKLHDHLIMGHITIL